MKSSYVYKWIANLIFQLPTIYYTVCIIDSKITSLLSLLIAGLTDFTTLSASILTASDGVTYRGVRLSWSHSSSYHSCSYIYYRAYISGQLPGNRRRSIDITFTQRQVDFLNLDCNTDYSFYTRVYYMSSSSSYPSSYSTRSVSIFYESKWKNIL